MYVHCSCQNQFHVLSNSFRALSVDRLPAVRAILRRPGPLRLVVVFWDSVAGGLRVGASRLGRTASRLHMAASGLDSASGCRVRAVVTSSAILGPVGVGRVGAVAGVVARAIRLVRSVGGGVRDHNRCSVAIAESNCGSFGGVRIRTFGRCRRHAGVDGLSNSRDSRRRAVRGLADVDSGSRRAGVFGLSRLAGVAHSNRAHRRAGRWNTSNSVRDGRDV